MGGRTLYEDNQLLVVSVGRYYLLSVKPDNNYRLSEKEIIKLASQKREEFRNSLEEMTSDSLPFVLRRKDLSPSDIASVLFQAYIKRNQ